MQMLISQLSRAHKRFVTRHLLCKDFMTQRSNIAPREGGTDLSRLLKTLFMFSYFMGKTHLE